MSENGINNLALEDSSKLYTDLTSTSSKPTELDKVGSYS